MAMNVLKLIFKYSFSFLLIPQILGEKLDADTCDAFKDSCNLGTKK